MALISKPFPWRLVSDHLNSILFIAVQVKPPKTMSSQERSEAIKAAIQSIQNDNFSYQEAAQLHGVKLRTLYHNYPASKKHLQFE